MERYKASILYYRVCRDDLDRLLNEYNPCATGDGQAYFDGESLLQDAQEAGDKELQWLLSREEQLNDVCFHV